MNFADDCDCPEAPRAFGFAPGRKVPPAIVERYHDTDAGHTSAYASAHRHIDEENRAGRFLYWCIHVSDRHLLTLP